MNMKQLFLFVFFLILGCTVRAQNYQCLQNGVQHYFTNGNGYLRCIKIDSSATSGDSTLFYPFRTPRLHTLISGYDDSLGGCWLGKKVAMMTDGRFIFDSYWNDSLVIKTQANLGESWTLYKDSTHLNYNAIVTGIDTQTVFGALDSVKEITVNALMDTTLLPTDSLNGFKILLSKNHGFVQVPDLYMFPYHPVDSVYQPGRDAYMDLINYNYIYNYTYSTYVLSTINKNNAIFYFTDYVAPNDVQLFNWDVGDVFESYNIHMRFFMPWTDFEYDCRSDSIVSKTYSGTFVYYWSHGVDSSTNPSLDTVIYYTPAAFAFNSLWYRISQPNFIPETVPFISTSYSIFYFPHDTSYCLNSPLFVKLPLGIYGTDTIYKVGIGRVFDSLGDDFEDFDVFKLFYSKYHGSICGNELPLNAPENFLTTPQNISIAPNPAYNKLYVTASSIINSIEIYNLTGQAVLHANNNTMHYEADITLLPAGMYFIKINGVDIRKFVKE